jgi:hypothetical protein
MSKRIKPFVYKKNARSPFRITQAGRARNIRTSRTELGTLKDEFAALKTGNLAADTQNFMAGIKNPYANIQTQFENVYEDLTVDQKAADLQNQQYQQSQANLLGKMQEMGMGGGGGMAQIIANQNTQQASQTAAGFGQQESANQRLAAQGAGQVQSMEREAEMQVAKGAFDVDIMGRQGEQQRQATILQGAADSRSLEFQQKQGLMALTAGELESQRLDKQASKNWFQRVFSDRKLKHNIVLVGESPSGLSIYNFEYKDSKYGEGVYQGVMSDEIPSEAVMKHSNGYDTVDYNKLDVDFIQITN